MTSIPTNALEDLNGPDAEVVWCVEPMMNGGRRFFLHNPGYHKAVTNLRGAECIAAWESWNRLPVDELRRHYGGTWHDAWIGPCALLYDDETRHPLGYYDALRLVSEHADRLRLGIFACKLNS